VPWLPEIGWYPQRYSKGVSQMSNRIPSEPPQISVKMTVRDQAQARELDLARREIISGERLARTEALEHDVQSIMDRAQETLLTIETAIGENPTSGQAGRLIRFIAGLYNGTDYPFDLTDLRALDTRLANDPGAPVSPEGLGTRFPP
jgi:hypothetical protein